MNNEMAHETDNEMEDEVEHGILPIALLGLKMQPNSLNAETIREYLIGVLNHAFPFTDGYTQKKPFEEWGMTLEDAQYELYEAFVRAELVHGMVDPLEEVDVPEANRLIKLAISAMGTYAWH